MSPTDDAAEPSLDTIRQILLGGPVGEINRRLERVEHALRDEVDSVRRSTEEGDAEQGRSLETERSERVQDIAAVRSELEELRREAAEAREVLRSDIAATLSEVRGGLEELRRSAVPQVELATMLRDVADRLGRLASRS